MKILSLFDGCAGAYQALKILNIIPEIYVASEIDKYAIKIAQKNFPNIIFIGDINDIDYTLNTKHGPFDLIVGGSPCFKAGTLIITDKGLQPIEQVVKGNKVLTHTNTFKEIVNASFTKSELYKVKVQGIEVTYVTAEHPYYVRTKKREWNNVTRIYDISFSPPYWKQVSNLTKNDRLAILINNKSDNIKNLSEEECWILGRYVADGYLRYTKRKNRKNSYNYAVILCIGKHKIKEIKQNIKTYHYHSIEERTAYKTYLYSEKLVRLCLEFGRGAINKKLPIWIENLPKDLLRRFIEGYMSGNGYFNKKTKTFSATSISRVLIHQLSRVIHKVYSVPTRFYKDIKPPTCIIEGRVVNQNDSYTFNYSLDKAKKLNAFVENDFVWLLVKQVTKTGLIDTVYNLTVDEDNSYCANNAVVHNCQGLSISKRNRKGLADPRSGLFWKMANIIEEFNPKCFLVENVASMSKESKLIITNSLGVEPILINSALLTAQSRKRLYWTNILNIVQPEDKHIHLKDILEDGGFTERDKSLCVTSTYSFACPQDYFLKSKRQLIFDKPVRVGVYGKGGQGHRVYHINGKSVTLSANGGGRGAKTGLYEIKKVVRKLTPIECERLQGLSDNFTEKVSNIQRYRMIGNGFTIPVIVHILSFMEEKNKWKTK